MQRRDDGDGVAARELREAARRAATRRSNTMTACELWRGLVEGRWSIVTRFDREDRGFLVVARCGPRDEPRPPLTDREREIAARAAMGEPNKLIAYALGVSIGSVSSHLSTALRKLGACTRGDLIILARARTIAPGDARDER
jgi:DNA-binding CsgD family transcriptional regulator